MEKVWLCELEHLVQNVDHIVLLISPPRILLLESAPELRFHVQSFWIISLDNDISCTSYRFHNDMDRFFQSSVLKKIALSFAEGLAL